MYCRSTWLELEQVQFSYIPKSLLFVFLRPTRTTANTDTQLDSKTKPVVGWIEKLPPNRVLACCSHHPPFSRTSALLRVPLNSLSKRLILTFTMTASSTLVARCLLRRARPHDVVATTGNRTGQRIRRQFSILPSSSSENIRNQFDSRRLQGTTAFGRAAVPKTDKRVFSTAQVEHEQDIVVVPSQRSAVSKEDERQEETKRRRLSEVRKKEFSQTSAVSNRNGICDAFVHEQRI